MGTWPGISWPSFVRKREISNTTEVEAAAKNDPMATAVFYFKSEPGLRWPLLPLFTSHTSNVYTSLQLGVGFDWTPKHYYGENMDLHFALSIGPKTHTLATLMACTQEWQCQLWPSHLTKPCNEITRMWGEKPVMPALFENSLCLHAARY